MANGRGVSPGQETGPPTGGRGSPGSRAGGGGGGGRPRNLIEAIVAAFAGGSGRQQGRAVLRKKLDRRFDALEDLRERAGSGLRLGDLGIEGSDRNFRSLSSANLRRLGRNILQRGGKIIDDPDKADEIIASEKAAAATRRQALTARNFQQAFFGGAGGGTA